MENTHEPTARTPLAMPTSVPLEIQGMPCVYVDLPADADLRVSFTRLGQLVPFQEGRLYPGAGILVIPPEVSAMIRNAYAESIRRAHAAGGGTH